MRRRRSVQHGDNEVGESACAKHGGERGRRGAGGFRDHPSNGENARKESTGSNAGIRLARSWQQQSVTSPRSP